MSAPVTAAAREVFRRNARTFWLAARLLPRQTRDDAAIVYAFCRLVDDTADEAQDVENARLALEALSNEICGLSSPRPLVACFRETAQRMRLPLESARELIAGVRSDLGPVRIADDAELVRYAYRVASTVGLMMCAVLGVRRREALPHAVDLGIAMQLTNIARDVAEDARRDRVYLPVRRLRAAGVDAESLVRGTAQPQDVARVVAQVLELADGYYRSADEGMRDLPARVRPAILVASRVYRAIGLCLRRRGCDALAGRTVVPGRTRAYWMARAAAGALTPRMLGWAPRGAHDRTLHTALRGLPGVNA
jgi:15-cis-phytoene synthase